MGTLLSGLSQRPPAHQAICLRLAMSALEAAAGSSIAFTSSAPPPSSATAAAPSAQASAALDSAKQPILEKFPFLGVPEDRWGVHTT